MILVNIATGTITFLSFLALLVTTASVSSFLSALFLFSSSVFLSALSLITDRQRPPSRIISICIFLLFSVSVFGMLFSVSGLAKFVSVELKAIESVHVMLAPVNNSIGHFRQMDITPFLFFGGGTAICVPFLIAIRSAIGDWFRRETYNLNRGFYGK